MDSTEIIISDPVLAREPVEVPSIGLVELFVRALLLSEQHYLWTAANRVRPGETADQAAERANAFMIPETLAMTVVRADGTPLWSADKWDAYAGGNGAEALRLYGIAARLNGGQVKAIEKN